MINDLDDTSARCPGFESTEDREDANSPQPVTLISYQRYKFKLYRIATPIAKTIYFHRGATVREVVERVRDIHQRLIEWNCSIPLELKLDSFRSDVSRSNQDPILKTFQLQALALQLSYDNIQLLLHRPLLAYTSKVSRPLSTENREENDEDEGFSNKGGAEIPTAVANDNSPDFSRKQCWESAMHTSRIGKYSFILQMARSTHAASYVGIQAFTAGVMLAMFALPDPLSQEAREAKGAIARLIKMPKLAGFRTHVSEQCSRILEGLLRLILAEEMKSLVSDETINQEDVFGDTDARSISKTVPKSSSPLPTGKNASNRWTPSTQDGATSSQRDHYNSADHVTSKNEMRYNAPPTTNFEEAQMSLQDGTYLWPLNFSCRRVG